MASQVANNCKELLSQKIIDFANDTFKMILLEAGFAFSRASHEEYADVLAYELATLYGYTVGGATMAGVTITNDAVLAACTIEWNNVQWTAAAGNLEASGAIIYDDTVAAPDTDPIIGYIDFGGTQITYNGGVFTVANPIVTIS